MVKELWVKGLTKSFTYAIIITEIKKGIDKNGKNF